jgi:isoquinoline 1-oxidoreductase beta subunit
VEQSNYHNYTVLRMSDVPEEMHIEFIESGMNEPTGLGELGNPAIPAAIAGAFYKLTGKRLSHMPFTRDRVLAALNA